MPEEKEKGLQQRFLEELVKSKRTVKVFITNGFQISGTIKEFDRYCIMVESDNKMERKNSLVFKSAISTITYVS